MASSRESTSRDQGSLCVPTKPFRCWQYRKDSTEPVPEWLKWIPHALLDNSWAVEEFGGGWKWYTPAEFQERFRIVEESNV